MPWLDVVQSVSGTPYPAPATPSTGTSSCWPCSAGASPGLFASGARVGPGELAGRQAAARATTVLLRHSDGSITV
ncbi:hypothetical protein [Streptomyces sp. NPDC048636]|uniref:hypothetical protein n=1 Tax=Streptomyces sp. NPDC048636 TaxID=3155762 RepID=UPI00343671BC